MAASGYADLLKLIPPTLISQWSITDPVTQSLGDCRILGSNDATYGTVGWVPRQDGVPFALLETTTIKDDDGIEANRVWSTYGLNICLAIDHADSAAVNENYNLITVAWVDALRQVVASNRRLTAAGSTVLYPTAGDVQWRMLLSKLVKRNIMQGIPYYSVEISTQIRIINAVNYEV